MNVTLSYMDLLSHNFKKRHYPLLSSGSCSCHSGFKKWTRNYNSSSCFSRWDSFPVLPFLKIAERVCSVMFPSIRGTHWNLVAFSLNSFFYPPQSSHHLIHLCCWVRASSMTLGCSSDGCPNTALLWVDALPHRGRCLGQLLNRIWVEHHCYSHRRLARVSERWLTKAMQSRNRAQLSTLLLQTA